jgi:hypothetical protein
MSQGEYEMKARNLVSKHARSFNKSAVMKDRKKAAKRGVVKHKNTKFDNYKIISRYLIL